MSDSILPTIVNDLKDSTMVHGIGGSQMTKEVVKGVIQLDCGWTGSVEVKPTKLEYNNRNLVILGVDTD